MGLIWWWSNKWSNGTQQATKEWTQNLDNGDVKIYQTIYVLKESQKAIVVGKRGSMIKEIGEMARKDIAELIGVKKVHLFLLVKVKNWLSKDFVEQKF